MDNKVVKFARKPWFSTFWGILENEDLGDCIFSWELNRRNKEKKENPRTEWNMKKRNQNKKPTNRQMVIHDEREIHEWLEASKKDSIKIILTIINTQSDCEQSFLKQITLFHNLKWFINSYNTIWLSTPQQTLILFFSLIKKQSTRYFKWIVSHEPQGVPPPY